MRFTNRYFMLGALAASFAGASIAEAATIDFSGSALSGNGMIDNSSLGLVSLSGDINNLAPVDLSIVLDASEQGGSLSFNGDFQVNTLSGLTGYRVEVLTPGVSISVVGDVLNSFGASMATSGDGIAQEIAFAPAEDLFFEIGDPLLAGSTNWTLDVSGLAPGVDRFSVRLTAIPEPGTALLLGLGLAAMAQRGRARRG